jgi:predicted CopG family antitoxin
MVTASTYERLKAEKREGESFTKVIERLLEGKRPRLADFATLFDRRTADQIAESFEQLRAEEIAFEKAKLKKERRARGRDA